MSGQCGIWIDHRRAFVVFLTDAEPKTLTVPSGVDRRVRAGGSRTSVPYGPQDAFPEDREQRRYERGLRSYYRTVADRLRNPEEIFVMGPGMAKGEFVKELEPAVRDRVLAVEAADSMTEPQMVAKVRDFFATSREPA